jgi:hypothetical protein
VLTSLYFNLDPTLMIFASNEQRVNVLTRQLACVLAHNRQSPSPTSPASPALVPVRDNGSKNGISACGLGFGQFSVRMGIRNRNGPMMLGRHYIFQGQRLRFANKFTYSSSVSYKAINEYLLSRGNMWYRVQGID